MGLWNHELEKTLSENDISFESEKFLKTARPTINAFFEEMKTGIYIISASQHYIAYDADSGTFADNGNYKAKKPLPIDKHPHPRAKVKWYCRITGGNIQPIQKTTKIQGKPESFEQLFDAYANDTLKEEVSARWEQISENVTSADAVHDIGDDFYKNVDADCGVSVNNAIAYWLECETTVDAITYAVMEDVLNMDILSDEEKRNITTLKMLAGKHKLKPTNHSAAQRQVYAACDALDSL